MERSRREDQACAYLAPPHHPLKFEKRPLQFPSLQTKTGCFVIQYQFHYLNDAARRRGLCSSIGTSVLGGDPGTLPLVNCGSSQELPPGSVLQVPDGASRLPGVVFQLVVVVQTVIAVVGSWPITAHLTALRVTGTSKRNQNNTWKK